MGCFQSVCGFYHYDLLEHRNVFSRFQYPNGIKPEMFKRIVGKGHAEFATKRQQDAQEYLLHVINLIGVSCLVSITAS